jgi:hypothetical protein
MSRVGNVVMPESTEATWQHKTWSFGQVLMQLLTRARRSASAVELGARGLVRMETGLQSRCPCTAGCRPTTTQGSSLRVTSSDHTLSDLLRNTVKP